jgi:hypothetical protein
MKYDFRVLRSKGRQANRLTPHPGPLPIEGRGSRASRFCQFRHATARRYRVEIRSRVQDL